MNSKHILKSIIIFYVAVIFLITAGNAQEPEVKLFYVKDFGAFGDGKTDDGPAIRKAIYAAVEANRPAKVIFESYQIYRIGERNDRWEVFDIQNAEDVTIEGNWASLVFSPKARGFLIKNSRRCTIRGFSIDYDPLPFTQGYIVAVNPENSSFDVKLHEGYPKPPSQQWMEDNYVKRGWNGWTIGTTFSPQKPGRGWDFKGVGHVRIKSVNEVSGKQRVYRITVEKNYKRFVEDTNINDRFIFIIKYSPWQRNKNLKGVPVANFRIVESTDCILENIFQYCSPKTAIHLMDNEGRITIRNYNILFKPGTNRLSANLSDGIHCLNNRIGPIIENCYFEGLLDDSININCMADVIQKRITDKDFLVRTTTIPWYKHPIGIGDEMLILDPVQGREIGKARVENVIYKQGQERIITLDRPILDVVEAKNPDDRKATQLFNLSRSGKDYIIRNNKFQFQTRNAILVRPGGLIENNIINGVGGHGVFLANDLKFAEGPVPKDAVIRNNKIVNCARNTGIVISCNNYTNNRNPLITNILDENNTIEGLGYGNGIFIKNAYDVKLKNNFISAGKITNPRRNSNKAPIRLESCKSILIEKNTIIDNREKIKAGIILTNGTKKEDIELINTQFNLRKGVPRVLQK